MVWGRLAWGVLRRTLCAALCCAALAPALACEGAQHIRLRQPVTIGPQEKAEFQALAPLRVLAVDAPPMARYDPERQAYSGIGVDLWCFIAGELGLRYEILPGRDLSLADKLRQVQSGRADAFMPLSLVPERARLGLFTRPYYESHYAVIARQGRQLQVNGLDDLARYRVGLVKGVALEPQVQAAVPADRLTRFDANDGDVLFRAVNRGALDLAVYSKGIFEQRRYRDEHFELEVIHTLRDAPREYRFYFAPSPQHQRIVNAFDRYLAAMDYSASIAAHENGERQLIERYLAQRSERGALHTASAAGAVLALALGLAFMGYRRQARLLSARHRHILQQQQALLEANAQLQRLSHCDALTGLANRRAFEQALRHEHARRQRTGAPLSLLLLDVDHFKSVNDHYGHTTGDDYLRAVARVLQTTVTRSGALAARHGGEEFACLLPDTGAQDALALAERIRQATMRLDLPNALAGQATLTVSLGVATQEAGAAGAHQLLHQADMQLYAAKRAGRNRVHATVLTGAPTAPEPVPRPPTHA